jgi:hypothetical protein
MCSVSVSVLVQYSASAISAAPLSWQRRLPVLSAGWVERVGLWPQLVAHSVAAPVAESTGLWCRKRSAMWQARKSML